MNDRSENQSTPERTSPDPIVIPRGLSHRMLVEANLFSDAFDDIASEIRRALAPGTEFCIRKRLGLIAWESLGQLRFVYLLQVNRVIYRFSLALAPTQNNLLDQIVDATDAHFGQRYPAQLNFHYSETSLIKGSDLVKFIEDCFRFPNQPKDIYRWPLFFASGRWRPRMAWTGLAQNAQSKLPAQEQLPKPVQLANHKFNPEPRTKKQEHHNDEILCELLEKEKRSYSPAARKQYRKLRNNLRRHIQASGHSEKLIVDAIVQRWPSQSNAQKLEDISPQFLRWVRNHWSSIERQLKERKR